MTRWYVPIHEGFHWSFAVVINPLGTLETANWRQQHPGVEPAFDAIHMPMVVAAVPLQPNRHDCGVYALATTVALEDNMNSNKFYKPSVKILKGL